MISSYILQDRFSGTGAVMPQCHWSNPKGYGYICHTNSLRTINTLTSKPITTKFCVLFHGNCHVYWKYDQIWLIIFIPILNGYLFHVHLMWETLCWDHFCKLCKFCLSWQARTQWWHMVLKSLYSLRLKHNGWHFVDNILKLISLNENCSIVIQIPMIFVSRGTIHNNSALVHIMAMCRAGEKPLYESMMA